MKQFRKKSSLTVLGIIPARGGSKGIRGKNRKRLKGKPLIYYAIRSARRSKTLTDFVVTTDDRKIAALARKYGAPVIPRPAALARDRTPMAPAVLHALKAYEKSNSKVDLIVLLQPTSPLRTFRDIDQAVMRLRRSRADALISVCRVSEHPAQTYKLRGGRLAVCYPSLEALNRQSLPARYHRNGAIYAIRRNRFLKAKSFYVPNTLAYVMPRHRSVNINESFDLDLANFLLRKTSRSQAASHAIR